MKPYPGHEEQASVKNLQPLVLRCDGGTSQNVFCLLMSTYILLHDLPT